MGVDTIVLTPHYKSFNKYIKNTKEFLEEEFQTFQKKIKSKIKFILGTEFYYDSLAYKDLKEGKIKAILDKYILVEFDPDICNYNIPEAIYSIKVLGYIPILAHAERYTYLTIDEIIEIKGMNCLIQINSGSLNGFDGKNNKKRANKILKNKLVDYIASDCHDLSRLPNIDKSIKVIKKYNLNKNLE